VLGSANNITGKVVFAIEGDELNVTECVLEPATLYQIESVIRPGLSFKKDQN
jgi:hypothetical protein